MAMSYHKVRAGRWLPSLLSVLSFLSQVPKETLMRKGFTLIELLIVVAIIAILAAIAVPNFLEAQVRAKVSRAKNDMRAYATGLESYRVDNNSYPLCNTLGTPINPDPAGVPAPPASALPPSTPYVLEVLSTPISYQSQGAFQNAFNARQRKSAATATATLAATAIDTPANDPAYKSYMYQSGSAVNRTSWLNGASSDTAGGATSIWVLHSSGPEQLYYNMGGILANAKRSIPPVSGNSIEDCRSLVYDPTNGTTSGGAIWRIGGDTNTDWGYNLFQAIQAQK